MTPQYAYDHALLNTDGGSRGNPGDSGIGFTITTDGHSGPEVICHGGAFIGQTTNNIAEYRALIWGLQNALALKVRTLDVLADSELMVKQLNGEYRVKNEGIKPLFNEARQLLDSFEAFTITHVFREDNSQADKLANEAMDASSAVGDFVVAYEQGGLFSSSAPKKAQAGSGLYTLTVKEHFDAAHALIGYPGQCRELHGHTWDVEVTVKGTELDEVGILYDFSELKKDLKAIIKQYDHVFLNDVPPFDGINATAENLARVIYGQMEDRLPDGVSMVEVVVWESPQAKLSYSR